VIQLVDKIVKEFPQLAGHESLRQLQADTERLRLQYETVKAEYIHALSENEKLRRKLGERESSARTTITNGTKADIGLGADIGPSVLEQHGVLWLAVPTGRVAAIAHCPKCGLPLQTFPPGKADLLRCHDCGFLARDLAPGDLPNIAASLQRQLAGESRRERPILEASTQRQPSLGQDAKAPPLIISEYQSMLDHAPVMIWRAGLDGGLDYLNDSGLRFTGRPIEQHVGNGWVESMHTDDRDHSVGKYVHCFHKRESFELRYRARRHDGVYRSIAAYGAPLYGKGGSFRGYVGACVDVSEIADVSGIE